MSRNHAASANPQHHDPLDQLFYRADATHYPQLVGCLDQGIFEILHDQGPIASAIPLSIDGKTPHLPPGVGKTMDHEGVSYPVKHVQGQRVAIDQSRVLLLFVVRLAELLASSALDPSFKFSKHYFKDSTKLAIRI